MSASLKEQGTYLMCQFLSKSSCMAFVTQRFADDIQPKMCSYLKNRKSRYFKPLKRHHVCVLLGTKLQIWASVIQHHTAIYFSDLQYLHVGTINRI